MGELEDQEKTRDPDGLEDHAKFGIGEEVGVSVQAKRVALCESDMVKLKEWACVGFASNDVRAVFSTSPTWDEPSLTARTVRPLYVGSFFKLVQPDGHSDRDHTRVPVDESVIAQPRFARSSRIAVPSKSWKTPFIIVSVL